MNNKIKTNSVAKKSINITKMKVMFDQAKRMYEHGLVEQAISIYKEIIENDPKNIDALYTLCIIYFNSGRLDLGIDLSRKAIKLKPKIPSLYNNCGSALAQLGLFDEAIHYFDKAVSLDQSYSEAYYNLGSAQLEKKLYQEALKSFSKAIKLNPTDPDIHNNYAKTFIELGQLKEALIIIDTALSLKPYYVEAMNNRGVILSKLGRKNAAIKCFNELLNIYPNYYEAYLNRGNLYIEINNLEKAIHDLERTIVNSTMIAQAYNSLGNALFKLRDIDGAIDKYQKAISINPNYHEALFNKAMCLDQARLINESLECYKSLIRITPDHEYLLGNYVHAKMKAGDWGDLSSYIVDIEFGVKQKKHFIAPLLNLYIIDNILLSRSVAEMYVKHKGIHFDLLDSFIKQEIGTKIRIGYFSPDFGDHPVGYLMAELFESHNPERFELYGFSLIKRQDSSQRSRLISSFDSFMELANISEPEAIDICRSFRLDIAIDLAGYTHGERFNLFFNRIAPIQVNYLGYPGTFGHECMDFIIADRRVIPESQYEFYFEKVVSLPDTYLVDDRSRVPGDVVLSRADCGLPESAFVFCAFNNNVKINPTMFDAWAKILSTVPNSVLWLSSSNETFQTNIQREAQGRGLDPDRLIFAERLPIMKEHLARYRHADIFLDTFPYNAHSTALDCLKSAVPIVTLRGQSFASRVAGSLLELLEVPELIAQTHEEYAEKAIALATDPERLAQIKGTIQRNVEEGPLFDTQRFTRNLEEAYTQMVHRHRNGLKPDHFSIAGYEIV